jgi:hypothetical protein
MWLLCKHMLDSTGLAPALCQPFVWCQLAQAFVVGRVCCWGWAVDSPSPPLCACKAVLGVCGNPPRSVICRLTSTCSGQTGANSAAHIAAVAWVLR